jgi:ADP-ribose pyrophosphatase
MDLVMLNTYNAKETTTLFSNPWWEYRKDIYEYPVGIEREYHYVHSRGSSFIIPQIDKNTFYLIRQYRYLNKRLSIEFPGGGIKTGQTSIETAVAELKEECGVKAEKFILLGEFNPFNGVTNEISSVYVAEELSECKAEPDDTEEFEILRLTYNEINEKIKTGEIWDGMTLAAWSLFLTKNYF